MPALIFCCLNVNKLYTTPAWVTPERQQTIYGLLTITFTFPKIYKKFTICSPNGLDYVV